MTPVLRTTTAALLLALAGPVAADSIGEVDTVFKLVGPDHKIVVDAHDDPKVQGVTCYVSRAKTGGIKGALGLAEDKAEASFKNGVLTISLPKSEKPGEGIKRIASNAH